MVSWPGPRPIVWAPQARTVDVVVLTPEGPVRSPMRLTGAHDPGYWGADLVLEPGTTYGFSIDGGPPQTDPLATWLPDGIDGLSRVLPPVEPDGGWTDDGWRPPPLGDAALLHLDVERFTPEGTFDAAAAFLPRIAATGVHGIELAPVADYDESGSPADGARIFAVRPRLGGSRGLASFVDAAHAHGLAVVLPPAFRWGVAPRLGLGAFGPYLTDGRINLDGSGSRGPRDFLIANAEWWFESHHIDGLSLDIGLYVDETCVIANHTRVPFLSALADATVEMAEALGRPLLLFVDGPGRSDRLTEAVRRVLVPAEPDPADLAELQRVVRVLSPTTRLPATDRRVSRAIRATRASSLVVGDLTRLHGARRAMPWAPDGEGPLDADLDARAGMLPFAWFSGTPLVLDTDHAPVTEDSASARRLLAWNAALAALRPEVIAGVTLGTELRVGDGALALRRGAFAVVHGWGSGEVMVDLADLVPGDPEGWEVAATWCPRTTVEGSKLRITGRTTAVLRARA